MADVLSSETKIKVDAAEVGDRSPVNENSTDRNIPHQVVVEPVAKTETADDVDRTLAHENRENTSVVADAVAPGVSIETDAKVGASDADGICVSENSVKTDVSIDADARGVLIEAAANVAAADDAIGTQVFENNPYGTDAEARTVATETCGAVSTQLRQNAATEDDPDQNTPGADEVAENDSGPRSQDQPNWNDVDLVAYEQQFGQAQLDFQRTQEVWASVFPSGKLVPGSGNVDSSDESTDTRDSDSEGVPKFVTDVVSPLKKAAETTSKVNENMRTVQKLLEQVEEGIERDEEELARRGREAAKLRAEVEAAKNRQNATRQDASEVVAAEAELADRIKKEEEEKERQRRKAEKREAKAKRKAEKAAAKADEKPQFPVSKTAALQGARMVAALPEDAEENVDDNVGNGKSVEEILNPVSTQTQNFDSHGSQYPLFERLKAELKETYLSFIVASMPTTLLRKYDADDLIGCLQIVLKEMRACSSKNCLEDVVDEDATTVAEELKEEMPNGWVDHLQNTQPWALRARFDVTDLVDTLQSLAGVCCDRLTEELGPLSCWVPEENILRKIPKEEPSETLEQTVASSQQRVLQGTPLSPVVGAATAVPLKTAVPLTRPATTANEAKSGFGVSSGTCGQTSKQTAAVPQTTPVFNAELGPALWEQEAMGLPTTAGPATAAQRAPAQRLVTTGGVPRRPITSNTAAGWTAVS